MEYPEYYDTVVELFGQGYLRKDIAEKVGVKPAALSWQMKKCGFTFARESYKLTPPQLEELVKRYSSGESVPSVCKDLPCSEDAALYLLRGRGVEIKTKEQLKFYSGYTINDTAFSNTDEEACAYFYGWILTDGCLSRRSVAIELSSKDEEILESLKTYLESSSTIRTRSRFDKRTGNTYHSSSFSFSHTPILERLQAFGLSPRKSLNEQCPDVFQENRHFWRGVIEGDGHIRADGYKIELCGGADIVESFATYCRSVCPAAIPVFAKNGKMSVVKISSKVFCKEILDELYKDCTLKLSRKYNIYLERYYNGIN